MRHKLEDQEDLLLPPRLRRWKLLCLPIVGDDGQFLGRSVMEKDVKEGHNIFVSELLENHYFAQGSYRKTILLFVEFQEFQCSQA